jgi:hypothetical protein
MKTKIQFWLCSFMVVILLIPASASFAAPLQSETHFLFAANAGWVASGINVEAGVPVTLRVSGIAITAPLKNHWFSRSGPDGQLAICPNYDGAPECAMNQQPYGATVAKIGADGTPFFVGSYLAFTPSTSGELFFAVNDLLPYYDDNEGYYIIFLNQ